MCWDNTDAQLSQEYPRAYPLQACRSNIRARVTLRQIDWDVQVYGVAGHFREQMTRFAIDVMPTFEQSGVIA